MVATARTVPVELLRALAVAAEPPSEELEAPWKALGLPGRPGGAAYAEAFVLELPPYASVYVGEEGMLGGEARERVAGFWAAVGRDAPAEPDHLSALLGLFAELLDEADRSPDSESAMVRVGAAAVLHEHLAPWVFEYLARLRRLPGPYAAWATLLERVLVEAVGVIGLMESLPAHLRAAPALSDPRVSGGEEFLTGLLAPVRSGFLLSRTDLTELGQALGLALRAGERRWVLRNLMAQDGSAVLTALGDAAAVAAAQHRERASWLGVIGSFRAERAARSEGLLRSLAAQAQDEPR